MPPHSSLPYRPCVGIMVLNRDGLVFIGRRTEGPEHVDLTHVWQMPQGGIDKGEDPWPAALRELHEETNIRRSRSSARSRMARPTTCRRRSPGKPGRAATAGRRRNGTRCASPARTARSTSRRPPAAHEPEFIEWRWEPMRNLPDLVIPFKRAVYERVVDAFAHLVNA